MNDFNPAEELRRIAQNDYMIDTKFLPDGKLLNDIADRYEGLLGEIKLLTNDCITMDEYFNYLDDYDDDHIAYDY